MGYQLSGKGEYRPQPIERIIRQGYQVELRFPVNN
jgi:hypothetical protein